MRYFVLAALAVLLAACGLIPTPPVVPVIPLTPFVTRTPTPVPTATAPTLTPTIPATPSPDPLYFRDDFDGSLDSGWTWTREDPENWSLVALPGALQINVAGGYVVAGTNPNLLLRSAPAGDFQIETRITFRPRRNYQFAGLIVYEDDSNFIQAGRSFCSSTGCVGAGLYMHLYEDGKIVGPDFGQSFGEIDPLQLRLSRRGATYLFEGSTNGKVWFLIGSHTSSLTPRSIGLVTGQRQQGENLPAAFEYFEVHSLR